MLNNILRLTFVVYIWKRYKFLIVSTVVLLAFFWIVGMVHSDYLQYAEINDDREYLVLSFVAKWLLFVAGVGAYLVMNIRVHRKSNDKDDGLPQVNSDSGVSEGNNHKTADPFEHVRKKDKLMSKADRVIEDKSK